MKLFLKDHLSIILLYLITFICLPILIDQLDGFKNHYRYFIFLAVTLLIGLLVIRYLRRKKMYTHLKNVDSDKENFLIHQPSANIEKVYAQKFTAIYSLLLAEEEQQQQFLDEQQLLISNTVHQMKTPVSVLQLLVQSNQVNSGNSLKAWLKVKAETNKINTSLNQLLSYSRSTKLLSDLKIEAFVLKKAINEVTNDLKDYFIEEELFPKVTIDENVLIYSDRKWLKVVFYQLLTNAIKYGDKHTTIHITYANNQLTIQNQGETIPKQDLQRIFDLFYTGTKGRKQNETTGIGLYLVKKILLTLDHSYSLASANHEIIFTITFSATN
ncbi:sensor histidine kinase [Tetragenococcus koreensis]|uniref:histidine kinase n=1 Tax=Tetragenococcus koreensis TaxID=290335 RepID=A0AAN4RK30_9ENTE|nr:sensor histidine kinase [Tetragenococcus koreensis]GEQ48771.1 two-component system sensor histidine kinase [Tetragenococcus koreensis]GEQ51238.1 two-component system sensor histidine kinase [Tetragenococcus koreensis]GEQ53887.1 two-component system sensor histidine kinase [Tetragenococcus koreensis]GEQ56239.1 two-component system sensor histidine kinase [Tetragenococcus koreensis]GEQ58784.1 two-component system sensor histidine kinase [Tetragenococcus koreensis]